MQKNDDLQPGGVDAKAFCHDAAAFQGADRAADARIQKIARREQRRQRGQPDWIIELASIDERDAEYIEGGDIGKPGIFAENFQIAEDEKDTDTPSDRSERQIVAGQPQRDEA